MNLAAEQGRPRRDDARAAAPSPNAWESALQAWQTVLELAPGHPIARIQPAAQAFIRERFSLERMIRNTLAIYDLEATGRGEEPNADQHPAPNRVGHAGRVPVTVDQLRGQP